MVEYSVDMKKIQVSWEYSRIWESAYNIKQ